MTKKDRDPVAEVNQTVELDSGVGNVICNQCGTALDIYPILCFGHPDKICPGDIAVAQHNAAILAEKSPQ